MIERITAAVLADIKDQLLGRKMHDPNAPDWADWSADGGSVDVERAVRVGVAAMRDPTDEMIVAGWRDFVVGPNPYEGPQPEDAWCNMIDEALR